MASKSSWISSQQAFAHEEQQIGLQNFCADCIRDCAISDKQKQDTFFF